MKLKLVLVSLLAAFLMLSNAIAVSNEVTVVPATEDVWIDVYNEQVYNSNILLCEVDAGYYTEDKTPGMSLVQFDISDINFKRGDIGILALKATLAERQSDEEFVYVVVNPVGSGWTEKSSVVVIATAVSPGVLAVADHDVAWSQNINRDVGTIAFDVSPCLREAKAKGGKISFILMAGGDTDYRVEFMSRETGEGPCLLVMPYPLGG